MSYFVRTYLLRCLAFSADLTRRNNAAVDAEDGGGWTGGLLVRRQRLRGGFPSPATHAYRTARCFNMGRDVLVFVTFMGIFGRVTLLPCCGAVFSVSPFAALLR